MFQDSKITNFMITLLEGKKKQDISNFSNFSQYKKYYFKEQASYSTGQPSPTGVQDRAKSAQSSYGNAGGILGKIANQPIVLKGTTKPTEPTEPTSTQARANEFGARANFTGGRGSGIGRGKGVPGRRMGVDALTGAGADGSGGVDSLLGMYSLGKASETGGDIASALGANLGKLAGAAGSSVGGFKGQMGKLAGGLLQKGGNLMQVAMGEIGKGLGTQWLEGNIGNIANTMQQAYAQDAGSPIGMVVPGKTEYSPAKATVKTDQEMADEKAARDDADELRTIEKAERAQRADKLRAAGYLP